MFDPRNISSIGLLAGFAQIAAIGLLESIHPPRLGSGGMSYEQVLAATLGYRKAQELLAEQRKKKRRGRRAREREMLLFSMPH